MRVPSPFSTPYTHNRTTPPPRAGPFDALFCVGEFYPGAGDDATAFEDYLCGALRVAGWFVGLIVGVCMAPSIHSSLVFVMCQQESRPTPPNPKAGGVRPSVRLFFSRNTHAHPHACVHGCTGAKEAPIPTYFMEGPPASAEAKYGGITGALSQ